MNSDTSEVAPSPLGPPGPSPTLPARLALWTVLGVVLLHSCLIALWVAPTNLLRNEIGAARVTSYILPMFDQAWSVFAPEADSQTDMFELRALVKDADGSRETAWTPVTEREIVASVRYHPFPSRSVLMTTRLGGYLQRAFNDLSQRQREIIADSGRDVSTDELRRELLDSSTNAQERFRVTSYLRVSSGTEYFLSGVADALWGPDVTAFQYRKYRIIATQYTNQQGGRQRRLAPELVSNWRAPHALTGADRSAYQAYVDEFEMREPR